MPRKSNAPRHRTHIEWTKDDIARMYSLKAEGKNWKEIAAIMHRTYSSVRGYNHLIKHPERNMQYKKKKKLAITTPKPRFLSYAVANGNVSAFRYKDFLPKPYQVGEHRPGYIFRVGTNIIMMIRQCDIIDLLRTRATDSGDVTHRSAFACDSCIFGIGEGCHKLYGMECCTHVNRQDETDILYICIND